MLPLHQSGPCTGLTCGTRINSATKVDARATQGRGRAAGRCGRAVRPGGAAGRCAGGRCGRCHGTCPFLVCAKIQVLQDPCTPRDMPSVGPQQWTYCQYAHPWPRRGTCPEGSRPCNGQVQCWSTRRDMSCRIHALRGTCLPGRAETCPLSGTCPALVPSTGHTANMPIPGRAEGHVLRDLGPAMDMSSVGLRGGTCPVGFGGYEGHVQRWVHTLGMSRGGQEATPPALPGPQATRVRGLRVPRPVPGVSR